ncbi:pyrimidine-nucleoside phosphorylase [Clostridium sp. ZBS15]|uniref:pyrimidine-nucleoside phosphorylase n=1 Tax=Clostridium sp. ZBS15 TaxID=2949969 RepID=UPI00207A1F0C|nr:pyrimidine-nucleoside phosphorylase [Clostridium sp. ZBS15]
MRFVDIINKKREKKELTNEEIQFWIDGVVNGSIPDYQTSSLLMAIVLNGMNERETSYLAKSMMHSGDVIDLTSIKGIKADKHSTGGVGDKTSMALGPMVAACGLKVAKMSGRGLGHTGGTLDKLESIEGFNCFLTEEDFINQVKDIGVAIIGQTGDLVPADKKLYALRDVTGTVNAIPLIASSIMSKKLASGSDTILLDVKYGEGAFMHTIEDATNLAQAMISIGNSLGRNTMAMITDMNQPLGNTIGNSLEIIEAIETLKGTGPKDFTELCMQAGEIMLMQGKLAKDKDEARAMLKEGIESGRAFEKFKDMVKAQGGNVKMIEDTTLLPKSKFITEIKCEKNGYVETLHSEQLGILAMHLGAGRATKEDEINHGVGLILNCKKGDKVSVGYTICYVHHDNELKKEWIEELHEAFLISDNHIEASPLIEKILK